MSDARPYGGKTLYEDAVGARNALGIVTLVVLAVIVAGVVAAVLVFRGHASGSDRMVWCAAPGETVDAAFKAEYPDLRMPKSECDRFNR